MKLNEVSDMRRSAFSLLLVAVAASGCGDNIKEPPPPEFDFTAVAPAVQQFIDEFDTVDGASYVVVHRDYGILHEETFGDHDLDTVVLLSSSGMVPAATVIMALVDDGVLDLDEPIASYLDWGDNHPEITLHHLLSNTSGLPGLSSHGFPYQPYGCAYNPTITLAECAEQIYQADLGEDVQPPGTVFQWGGGGWQLLGAVAEQATGKKWNEIVEEQLGEPCGLNVLTYGQPPFTTDMFNNDPANLGGRDNPNLDQGAIATPQDYAKILQIHLQGGQCDGIRVLSEESVEAMRVDYSSEVGGDPYGYGWFIEAETNIYSNPGFFGTYVWIDAARGYGVYISLESIVQDGTELYTRIRPLIEEAIDNALQ